jgi:hypothetical protein
MAVDMRSVGCTSKRCTMGSEKRARFPLVRSSHFSAAPTARSNVGYRG